MKQSSTIHNDQNYTFQPKVMQVIADLENSRDMKSVGKHIINNIMNYSRSLQVLKDKQGEVYYLICN